MAEDSPRRLPERFFSACLLVLGGVIALCLALDLLSQIWGWLLLIAAIALTLCCAVAAYRYWWGRRF